MTSSSARNKLMIRRVLPLAVVVGVAVVAATAVGQHAPAGPFDMKFDADGKLLYSAELVKNMVADARAHGDARRGASVFHAATAAGPSCHKIGGNGGDVGPD